MSVVRAFFHSGCLNAGTPLEIASTPVTAAPPDANAFRMIQTASRPVTGGTFGIGNCDACDGRVPPTIFAMPTPIMRIIIKMKKYVGTAKSFPDSRTPRRFPIVIRTMKATEMRIRYGNNDCCNDVSACVPAATDTETVRM